MNTQERMAQLRAARTPVATPVATPVVAHSALLEAFFDAIDDSKIGFARVAKKITKRFAAEVTVGEISSIVLGMSEGFDEVAEVDPEGADLLQKACLYALKVVAGHMAPDARMTEEEYLTSLYDLPGHAARTHAEWVQWIVKVGEMDPKRGDVEAAISSLLNTLYEGGVDHGRFYIQNSLAWTAWSTIGYNCVSAARWAGAEIQVKQACGVLCALMGVWQQDVGQGMEVMDDGSVLDAFDDDSGRRASSFATILTSLGSGREDQKAPFPEDYQALFQQELERDVRKQKQYQEKVKGLKASTFAAIKGRITK